MTSDLAQSTVQAVSPQLGGLGASFYFTPETMQRGKELGIQGGFAWYVAGRGGVLGDVHAEVIHSAFAFFERGLLFKMWERGLSPLGARETSRQFAEAGRAHGRKIFAGIDGLGRFADLAEKVIAATDSSGLALFAGWKGEPLGDADDPAGRALLACNALRELRGSAHIVAITAVGISPEVAHFTTGGHPRWKALGFAAENAPEPDPVGMAEAERLTDAITARGYAALTEAESAEFIAVVNAMHAAHTAPESNG